MSVQIKLGWWRDKSGAKVCVSSWDPTNEQPWVTSLGDRYSDNGSFFHDGKQSMFDLLEFIRPLVTELPPTLNTAVKAAEDRVRELKQMVDESQVAWATACRLHEAARKELERLEKECEVKP